MITMHAEYPREVVINYFHEIQTPLYVGIDTDTFTEQTEKYLNIVKPSGVILLDKNIRSYKQTKDLISEIHEYARKRGVRIRIAIDEEGGTVSRLSKLKEYPQEFTGLKRYEEKLIRKQGELLNGLKIDVNFAPVVDIAFEKDSPIQQRSISDNPQLVGETATKYLELLNEYRIESTFKHFPGLGRTTNDTHKQKAVIDIDKELWIKTDSVPYRDGIAKGLANIMVAHVRYPKIDSRYATVSKKWNSILRDELGFKGKTITDDLKMLGIEEERTFYNCNGKKVSKIENEYIQYSALITKSLQSGINHPLIILSQKDTERTVKAWLAIEKDCIYPYNE